MRRMFATLIALGSVLLVSAAQSADTLDVHLVSQTTNNITLGWTPQAGYGYLFSTQATSTSGLVLVSRTNNATRSTVTFAKGSYSYEVAVITKGANGHYPSVQPPPSTGTITQTIANGSTVNDITGWRAAYDADGNGTEDDPGKVEFYIDGVLVLTEINAPFGDTFAAGAPSTAAGQHAFEVRALIDSGTLLASNRVVATVSAAPPSPPPPPPPGGYPNASNTGVPPGTTLTTRSAFTANTAGAVYTGLNVTGCISVTAPGVTIQNSKVECIDVQSGAAANPANPRLTVQDVEVDCINNDRGWFGKGIIGRNFTVIRTDIIRCEDGVYVTGNTFTLKDSFIHDLDAVTGADPHNDGIQIDNDGSNGVIDHNTIYAVDTSAIQFCNNTGCPTESNVTISNNLLAGGGWTVYCPKNTTVNFRIINNAFSTIFHPKVGGFGPATDCGGEIQSGNFIYETGAPLVLG